MPVANERKRDPLEECATKKLFVLVLAAALTPMAAARVWTSVYRYDGRTPLTPVDSNHPDVYREIMVGTRLTLIISSDTSDSWAGFLQSSWDDAPYGKLSGRGDTTPSPGSPFKYATYKDSCLDAAGTKAIVQDVADSEWIGLAFSNFVTLPTSGRHPAYPGDWFVVDYRAEQVGDCKVGLYGYDPVGPVVGPETLIQMLSFTHVPSRDFNGDTVVDFKDFARFAAYWRSAADPNTRAGAAFDFNTDRRIGGSDLASFSRYWLERTDSNEPPAPSATAVKS
ncbi:MAG: hypothetical protein NTZ17_04085 [Phycisphaerae bacterium]|nr:hypothetical protein [Phycisphaerae bacterium]